VLNSTPRPRLQIASALLAVLAITTGWVESGALDRAPGAQSPAGASSAVGSSHRYLSWRDDAGWPGADGGAPHATDASEAGAFSHFKRPAPRLGLATRVTEAASSGPASLAKSLSGRNRFWIPSLGLSYPVQPFECSRSRPPDNFIYRWGCAGTNNVYILGHAWGVMKPLHDAYVAGRLRVGMIALYADGNGQIRSYRVTEWRVVLPTEVAWQIADQPVPSMTLQTCVGNDSRYRLNVRLISTD
jgi:hypothetical protein